MRTTRNLACIGLTLALAHVPAMSFAEGQPGGKPNILIVVADDLGYSDLGVYGGEIRTPVLDDLAQNGVLFTNFYTHASCSPTRSMLMSGTDNHLAGVGIMNVPQGVEQVRGGYDAVMRTNVATLPELLQGFGYNTYLSGKWHLGSREELLPNARGFDRSFALMQGGASHFKQEVMGAQMNVPATWLEDGQPVELPDDFYSSTFLTDYMISAIDAEIDSGEPFFAYLSYTAPHWPVQAPAEDIAAYRGQYDAGYESIAAARMAQREALGLTEARDPEIRQIEFATPWDSLDAESQAIEARKMEAYAASITVMDRELGRLVAYLEEQDALENTLILFLSDNGAEGGIRGNGLAEQMDNSLDNIGLRNSFVEMGPAWAQVSSTPNRMWKYTGWEGGYRVPAFIHWPAALAPMRSDAVTSVMNVLPTVLEAIGERHPGLNVNGRQVLPMTGVSMMPMLRGERDRVYPTGFVLGWEINNFAALRKDNWKIVYDPHLAGIADEGWALYDLDAAGGEWVDLAAERPDVLADMLIEWEHFSSRNAINVDANFLPARPYP